MGHVKGFLRLRKRFKGPAGGPALLELLDMYNMRKILRVKLYMNTFIVYIVNKVVMSTSAFS